mgnify:FL=1
MEGKNILDIARVLFMLIGTAVEALTSNIDGLTWVLVGFLSIDYITGVICAFCNKTLSSQIGAKGILKKFSVLCVVAVSALIGTYVLNTDALKTAVTLYYISNEGISIVENCTKLGIPIPTSLKTAVRNVCNSENKETKE